MRFLVIIFISVLSFALQGQEYLCENGTAKFLSVAPLNEFEGESSTLKGLINLDNGKVDFYLDLSTLKTGITLRDKHMKENYLETKKYPFAEFTGQLIDFNKEDLLSNTKDSLSVTAQGIFKMHGKDKTMNVNGIIVRRNDSQFMLSANFEVILSEFDIKKPSILFYELAENQSVSIALDFRLKK